MRVSFMPFVTVPNYPGARYPDVGPVDKGDAKGYVKISPKVNHKLYMTQVQND